MVVLHCKRVLSSPGPERARSPLTLLLLLWERVARTQAPNKKG